MLMLVIKEWWVCELGLVVTDKLKLQEEYEKEQPEE